MPRYVIYRLKDAQQEQFRWAPHTSGPSVVRPKDYREDGWIEAPTPYAAWALLRERGTPLRVGDLLKSERGELQICKYVGFEEARWQTEETVPAEETEAGSYPEMRPS
jgi:hypothetical protein